MLPLALIALLVPAQAQQPQQQPARTPAGAPLHPIITEVLYAVPRGPEGDANRDGLRDALGDEFVELYNPHDKPIRLDGYTINDRNPPGSNQVSFVFPRFELSPRAVVVVFNGVNQTWTGPVGDSTKAPDKPHDDFDGAWVFTMGNTSKSTGFANDGDWVVLLDPKGEPVSCVAWGKTDTPPPFPDSVVERAPNTSSGSVQRTQPVAASPFTAHPTIGGLRYSPGTPPGGRQASAPADEDR